MADIYDTSKRSTIMASIRGANTKPEMIVRRHLHIHGFRYRLHDKKLPGKPDIVLKKYKTVIFVNGCFWHGHDCPRGKLPETNKKFWHLKISANRERDKKNIEKLEDANWKVFVIWQCNLKQSTLDVTAYLNKMRTNFQSSA